MRVISGIEAARPTCKCAAEEHGEGKEQASSLRTTTIVLNSIRYIFHITARGI